MSTMPTAGSKPPFDQARLDAIMDSHGVDVLILTSKHNVQYMLGGYKFIFFSAMDAIGHSRYLPVFVYKKGRPDLAAYFANKMEVWENQNGAIWAPTTVTQSWTSVEAMEQACNYAQGICTESDRIAVEMAFLPADAYLILTKSFGDELLDATQCMERMRAVKSAAELSLLRTASDLITDSMLATFAQHGAGSTKRDIIKTLKIEETKRGLDFDYCLISMGASHNRAATDQKWEHGDVLMIDSGGNYHGYIGDLCRMCVLGEPDPELEDLLAEVSAVQQVAIDAINPGVSGGSIISAADEALKKSASMSYMDFLAHGMGLVSHEAPFLVTNRPVSYNAYDAQRPLEIGMVVSVETTLLHPKRGLVKLEDTVAVTEEGGELLGAHGRGWNRAGRP